MRLACTLLACLITVGSAVQAYAQTLSEAHCRARGHTSATAVNAAHDPTHAAHHHTGGRSVPAVAADMHQGHGGPGEQCQCGCLCGQLCVMPAGVVQAFQFAGETVVPHYEVANAPAPAYVEHPAPQRPPATLS